jgi:hypothetical protein
LLYRSANLKPVSIERRNSINRVTEVKEFGYYDVKKRKYIFTNDVYKKNNIDFANYKINCNKKALVYVKNPKLPEDFSVEPLVLPYITRFTDKIRQHEIREKYKDIWASGAENYDKALMLTLTVDPAKIHNLWEGNKKYMKAVNRFKAFLVKRFQSEKKRVSIFEEMYQDCIKGSVVPDYEYLSKDRFWKMRRVFEQIKRTDPLIEYKTFKEHLDQNWFDLDKVKKAIDAGYKMSQRFKNLDDYKFSYQNVLEFQKNGRLHSHITIFGLDFLMDLHELSLLWDSYGMGRIVHAYGLKRNEANSFTWAHKKPTDARNVEPDAYLMKYLLKAQYTTSSNYWVYNTRFYTNSRTFEDSEGNAILRKIKRMRPSYWAFIGTIKMDTPDFRRIQYISMEDSLKFAGVLAYNPAPIAAT